MITLILGANSDIAKAIAVELKNDELILASRNIPELKSFVDLNNIKAKIVDFDALNFNSHEQFFNENKNIDCVICAFGYLGNQENAQTNFKEAQLIIQSNFTGCVSILDKYATHFQENKKGQIVGISSVAGDRGRKSNYYYGASKAAFDAYLSGLRNRLFNSGVKVLTVKPGFVETKMLKGIKTPAFLTASPTQVAKKIVAKKGTKNVIYITSKWYWVMCVIKYIPEFIFKRMNL